MGDPYIKERPKKLATPAHSPSLEASQNELYAQIDAICWRDFDTAYKAPESVPLDLKLLMFGDQKQALNASHRLWCGLCHQHAYMSSAAEPALPFLMLVLFESGDLVRVEVLDILLGFVRCQRPDLNFTQRVLRAIRERRPEIEKFKESSNDEVASFAESVCEALDENRAQQGAALDG
ncbi:hypothetical protein [Gimesia aquarii]|uniref:Uncharacterized protein n=1 Tax=Gimesia aquarii TaxID=2527964 RepID=A0A517W3U0_9PLAN|nr:hypothetical protein [Gimesia aquarii]QDT99900.1 hypothetical protein V144x_54140 [Gimesia aquarii]